MHAYIVRLPLSTHACILISQWWSHNTHTPTHTAFKHTFLCIHTHTQADSHHYCYARLDLFFLHLLTSELQDFFLVDPKLLCMLNTRSLTVCSSLPATGDIHTRTYSFFQALLKSGVGVNGAFLSLLTGLLRLWLCLDLGMALRAKCKYLKFFSGIF